MNECYYHVFFVLQLVVLIRCVDFVSNVRPARMGPRVHVRATCVTARTTQSAAVTGWPTIACVTCDVTNA